MINNADQDPGIGSAFEEFTVVVAGNLLEFDLYTLLFLFTLSVSALFIALIITGFLMDNSFKIGYTIECLEKICKSLDQNKDVPFDELCEVL